MSSTRAFAKINLGLVVGPLRADGRHEIVSVLEHIDLHDEITLEPAGELVVAGFPEDTIVRRALESYAEAAAVEPCWHVRIVKRIPVAAGLGGGSADAAAALLLANAELGEPLDDGALHGIAAGVGADVPFLLREGAHLATSDGTELTPVVLPTEYHVVLVVPHGDVKESTRLVYDAFDRRGGADGFAERVAALRHALASVARAPDLASLPANDLASSPIARELEAAGAFRADVSGAGPTVYGLFEHDGDAVRAAAELESVGRTLVTRPVEAGRESRVAR